MNLFYHTRSDVSRGSEKNLDLFAEINLRLQNNSEGKRVHRIFTNLLVKTLGYGQTQPKEIDILNADSSRFLKLTNPMVTKVKEHVREIMQESSLSSS